MIGANREEHKDLYIKYLEKFSNDLQDLEKDRRHFQDRYTEFLESHKDQFEGYIL
ncbi:MAG: hypothetical protein LBD11_03060 [Candidatus Peribacteria bacterium]|jgi:hypothetical protein|nr:hypothetical protein [Candidatus Peribacteria bacterium]